MNQAEVLNKLKAMKIIIDEIVTEVSSGFDPITVNYSDPITETKPVDPLDGVPSSVIDDNPDNPADTDEKKKKLEEQYDYVSKSGQGWNKKKDEGENHLKWRAENEEGEEPEFIK
jgi:hypothetical protein